VKLIECKPTRHEKEVFQHFKYADRCWKSSDGQFWVTLNHIKEFDHLKVRRADNMTMNDFNTLQAIKNIVLGKKTVAVQIFPKQADLVDGSNTYHLWTWDGIEAEAPNLKTMPRYH
jgi:hypothetical protein